MQVFCRHDSSNPRAATRHHIAEDAGLDDYFSELLARHGHNGCL
jgi:hypothetical protein